MNNELLEKLIDHIESLELKLLTWGIVDFYFTQDELEAIIFPFIQNENLEITPGNIIEDLVTEKLLFEFHDSLYRTRTAETVRLIAKLKQLFPYHKAKNSWPAGKNLVGDFRFIKRFRKRPNREQYNLDQLLWQLTAGKVTLTDLQIDVLTKILNNKTLAGFQVRAIQNILSFENSDQNNQRGILISAGTGSGKTWAFYFPVLLSIVKTIEVNSSSFTKCISIYPRNELLKDQLIELQNLIRVLNPLLISRRLRPIRLGAFFGMTPNSKDDPALNKFQAPNGIGVIIPYLKCPIDNCKGSLVWSDEHREIDKHIVKCTDQNCNYCSGENEIALTRKKIISDPPDILFTTTEMMNRHLANYEYGSNKIWGIGQENKPGFLLFDEIHTYSGNHGASVSYLLKRYIHLLKSRPVIAGLSATLKEGKKFFARFSGIDESFVADVYPGRSELKNFGAEYKMILRNDPAEKAQLLSTTIQLLMLIRRCMDPSGLSKHFGEKVFAFTDDLDVTNRLYHNLKSAEHLKLPSIRNIWQNEDIPNLAKKFDGGQYWKLCLDMGFNLNTMLKVDRTSSQDAGVNEKVDIVVATAALEVGYNDRGVGAIIQHKTPRSAAQLIQREGRAGRTDQMRPWTVAVLSDFGIDRITFQSYERLFDPELEPNSLPLDNLYIIKIQAVYSFIEWISLRLHFINLDSNIWNELRLRVPYDNHKRNHIINLIYKVIEDEFVFNELKKHLTLSLSINENTLDRILWEPPRSLMIHVIPTLLRRLEKNWSGEEYQQSQNTPLPDFLPSTLFTDLNLPELEIDIRNLNQVNSINVEEKERMGFFQGINEYAPGNVSARYTIKNSRDKHWIPIPYDNPDLNCCINIDNFIRMPDAIVYGSKSVLTEGGNSEFIFIRPQSINVEVIPQEVKDYSKAFLKWYSTIEANNLQHFNLHIPSHPFYKNILSGIDVHLHSGMGQLTVDRLAVGVSTITTLAGNTEKIEKKIKFISEKYPGKNIAYGTRMYVDGIKVRFLYPDLNLNNQDLENHLNLQYFRHKLRTTPEIESSLNIFDLELLEEFIIYTIVNQKFNNNLTIEDVIHSFSDEQIIIEYINEYTEHFGDPSIDSLDQELNPDNDHRERLQIYFARFADEIQSAIYAFNTERDDPDWIKKVYKTTLGVAVLESIKRFVKDVMDTDLILDLEDGINNDHEEDFFYITESSPGSMGIIERFIETYNQDPYQFYRMLISIVSPEDEELVNTELSWLLQHAIYEENTVSLNFAAYRNSDAINDKEYSISKIAEYLRNNGRSSSQTIISSLSNRILFSGSNINTDELINSAHTIWRETENILGFEIETRIFSEVLANNQEMRDQVTNNLNLPQDDQLIISALYRLLWPKGGIIRNRVLSCYNPFSPHDFTDKLILSGFLTQQQFEVIELVDEASRQTLIDQLVQTGAVILKLADNEGNNLDKAKLHNLIVTPVENDVLFDYPSITQVKKEGAHYLIELTSGISR